MGLDWRQENGEWRRAKGERMIWKFADLEI